MLPRCALLLFLLTTLHAPADEPTTPALTADAIMAKVATNQDRTEAARAHFVYVQHAKVTSRKGKTIMCEETTDFRITPNPAGQKRALLSLAGVVRTPSGLVHYTQMPREDENSPNAKDIEVNDDNVTVHDAEHGDAPVRVKDTDIDLVEHMRRDFTSDDKSKDGVNAGLFPLTSKEQKDMVFELKGRELKNGRDTFRIAFHPKDKDDFGWKGEAWIDAKEFQPVVVRTALSRSIPFAVRALLGTNVPGLGFTVIYAPQQDNVWFPVSFGTEFKVKLLFFFSRQIVVAVENRSFEQTHVTTTIHGADVATP